MFSSLVARLGSGGLETWGLRGVLAAVPHAQSDARVAGARHGMGTPCALDK
jgi:hypothetical protein